MLKFSRNGAVGFIDWLGQNQPEHLQTKCNRRDDRPDSVDLLPTLPYLHRVRRRSRRSPGHKCVVDRHVNRHGQREYGQETGRGQGKQKELRSSDAGTEQK